MTEDRDRPEAEPSQPYPLQVILAGYNGDAEVLASGHGAFSPETISAAYARISRSPDPVPALREKARAEVERARSSNRTIVFGLGHHSVAEHAVLNFDILSCSRIAIEALQWHRLCSFTEKSQRYITLDGDYVIPQELAASDITDFVTLIDSQNDCYQMLLPLLLQHLEQRHPEMLESKAQTRVLEGWAKEDARYAVSLATQGQLGFTANARNLELVIRRLRHSPLAEVRRLSELLFAQAQQIAPSLIILADAEGFKQTYGVTLQETFFTEGVDDLRAATADVVLNRVDEAPPHSGAVTLVGHTPDPDAAVISALLFRAGKGSLVTCQATASAMNHEQRLALVRRCLNHLSEYDALSRAFEEAVFRFELVLDASAMAQLKRHRMATQHWGSYDPELGFTVPPAIAEIGQEQRFAEVIEQSTALWHELRRSLEQRGAAVEAADYALTNAHRRRLALTMNLREVYHFSRLREDCHAQWAIQELASDVSALVRRAAPATSILLGGKDSFPRVREEAFREL